MWIWERCAVPHAQALRDRGPRTNVAAPNRGHFERAHRQEEALAYCLHLSTDERKVKMMNLLWAVAAILFVLWILGFALQFSFGGLLHVLLALAIVAVLARIIMGHRIA